jgi:hypothetical protein
MLLDRAAVIDHQTIDEGIVAAYQLAQLFGIEQVRKRGESGEIRK